MTDANAQTSTGQSVDDFLGVKPQPKWRKWAVRGAIGAVLLILLFLLSRCFAGDEAPRYATQAAAAGDLTVTVSATGNLQPTVQVEVGSELSGLITDVYVDNNDRVKKGQVLAKLDLARLDDAIAQSRAQVQSGQAQIAQAQASAQLARANLARLEEVSRLSGGRVPAKTELDNARAQLAQANASVRTAQAAVAQANAALSSNQTQRSRAFIMSPVNGVVLSRQIEPGQTVAASFNAPVLFQIAEDLSQMELEVKVDEADVGQVKAGQDANFAVDAFPGRNFPAKVTRVDLGANASDSTSSSSTSTSSTSTVVAYTAALSVSNPDLLLRPGMTATADIVTVTKKNVLLVPNAALRFRPAAGDGAAAGGGGGITGAIMPRRPRGGRSSGAERSATVGRGAQQTIYVKGEDGQPRAIQVTTGDTNGAVTEVTGGDLKPGMEVITGQLAAGAEAPAPAAGQGGARRSGGGGGR
ncbi:efflux RND transporter periplasmic adaptor subunit [Sphingomonas sanxanigenens]|uniref:Uncharacterized protein n=1 Tax=Sphingomonas sanxanigenens DSM 19645 = NX02 TaxID=1123269 RepID=W0ABI0_9SPHN|nr:efflux RND transporter periplasmic adaptor subunit [Sphingomonas sanxanigenens]AHE53862.1 hypothetical protein NX02_10730 [Sphingomonas sanxanigenens DSM 19645 = NX02]